MNDFVDTPRGHADILGEPVLRNTERLEKIESEDLAWMNWGKLAMSHLYTPQW